MKIVKPTNLGLLPRPFTFAGEHRLCVAAFAFFSFAQPRELLEESSMWETLEKTLLDTEIFDAGEPKPRAEYLVYGHCHPKENARAARIRLRVGKQEKTLEIYGNRTMQMGVQSDPEMLDPLRICWRYAYGGAGHPVNPRGMGFNVQEDGSTRLPNILAPNKAADPQDESHKPAGLTAYPPSSPLRSQHYGTFDKNWLRDCWPALPTDSNPEIFMTAPEDQRFEGYLHGDEQIFIEGMHPQNRFQETVLPGLRVRIFAQMQGEPPAPFVEAEARPETLWLLPENELAIICYRAQIPTSDDEASDITHLLAVWEQQEETPQTSIYYHTFLAQQLAEEQGLAAEAEAAEEAESADKPEETAEETAPEAPKPEDPEIVALKEETAKIEAETKALQKKHGISDAELEKHLASNKPPSEAPLTEADLQKATAQIEAETQKLLKEKGMTMADVERIAKERSGMDQVQDFKALMRQSLENDKLPADAKSKLRVALAEFTEAEQALAAAEAELAAAGATIAPPVAAAPEEPEPEPQGYAGQDLSGQDFSGQDLRDADFSQAVLSGCNFSGADCARANFSNTVLDGADFTEARCENTLFSQAAASKASFKSANLRQAVLTGSDFSDSDFSGAKLREAELSECLFLNARMWNLAADKSTAVQADFSGADLTGSDFSEAQLEAADFSNVKIDSTQFSRVRAREARFFGAHGENVRFESADLTASRADATTDLPEAGFSHALLDDSNWGGARLPKASCIHTAMDRADFSGADLSGATFNGVTARQANFSKALLEGAHLQHCNLFFASLRKASLVDAKLNQSNLFSADLYKIRLGKTQMTELNLKRTLLDPTIFED